MSASVSIGVFDADWMAAPQVTMIERAPAMIDKAHVSTMAETHRLSADTEADVVRAVALVNAIVMICKSSGR